MIERREFTPPGPGAWALEVTHFVRPMSRAMAAIFPDAATAGSGGVVTDRGGTLSHAALVAREYGIPAVVGTGNATERIRDGARIRIDGANGLVELLA